MRHYYFFYCLQQVDTTVLGLSKEEAEKKSYIASMPVNSVIFELCYTNTWCNIHFHLLLDLLIGTIHLLSAAKTRHFYAHVVVFLRNW
jgi:hypothetical protein